MENIIKHEEKELCSDRTQKIFGIIKNKEKFQNCVEASLAFSTHEMAKGLLNYKKQTELTRDKAIMQTRCLTRLL